MSSVVFFSWEQYPHLAHCTGKSLEFFVIFPSVFLPFLHTMQLISKWAKENHRITNQNNNPSTALDVVGCQGEFYSKTLDAYSWQSYYLRSFCPNCWTFRILTSAILTSIFDTCENPSDYFCGDCFIWKLHCMCWALPSITACIAGHPLWVIRQVIVLLDCVTLYICSGSFRHILTEYVTFQVTSQPLRGWMIFKYVRTGLKGGKADIYKNADFRTDALFVQGVWIRWNADALWKEMSSVCWSCPW